MSLVFGSDYRCEQVFDLFRSQDAQYVRIIINTSYWKISHATVVQNISLITDFVKENRVTSATFCNSKPVLRSSEG
jgi:hypothetical protein